MKTIKINIGFTCEKCGYQNAPAEQTCRNHCSRCLFSKHVDQDTPGDRKSSCLGLMEPIRIDYNSKKGMLIHHRCTLCNKEIVNKCAQDDNINEIAKIMSRQNLGYDN